MELFDTSGITNYFVKMTMCVGGMKFIPIEYDIHPNEFHTYGMNLASMTFILATVRTSYRGCKKTFFIPKLRVKFTPRWQTALLGQRPSKLRKGNLFMRSRKFYIQLQDACSAAFMPAVSSGLRRLLMHVS